MNKNSFYAVILIITLYLLTTGIGTIFAENDENETIVVEAVTENKIITTGNVRADDIGVYVGSANGFTAQVTAKDVAAIQTEEAKTTYGVIAESEGNASRSSVKSGNITTDTKWNNHGLVIQTKDYGMAEINAGSVTGWMGLIAQADTSSSIDLNLGGINGLQLGAQLSSLNNGQINAETGIIFADAEVLSANASGGGETHVDAGKIISDQSGSLYGVAEGQDSVVTINADEIQGKSGAIRISAENGGIYVVNAKDLTIQDSGWEFLNRYGIDSMATSGTVEININGHISLKETGEKGEGSPAGIYVQSKENGSTVISTTGNVSISSEKSQAAAYGIKTINAGGNIDISIGNEVSVISPGEAIGLCIENNKNINNPGRSQTTVSINSDLSGSTCGLFINGSESMTDITVSGTISGNKAGIIVGDDITPGNFFLTVGEIVLNDQEYAIIRPDGSPAEDFEREVSYLLKIAPQSQEVLTFTDDNDNPLQTAKEGDKVYLRVKAGENAAKIWNKGKELQKDDQGRFFLIVPKGGAILVYAETKSHSDFHRLPDHVEKLPDTGFSSVHNTMLPARPKTLDFKTTGLTLQIPKLEIMKSIVTVPVMDDSYPVKWLNSNIGLLEGTALPGEGLSILTGHNHLSTTEAGPFVFLSTLEKKDLILVTDSRGNLQNFRVAGNYLITPEGLITLADKLTENTLLLVTCEDESIDGSYLHRRVILASPE